MKNRNKKKLALALSAFTFISAGSAWTNAPAPIFAASAKLPQSEAVLTTDARTETSQALSNDELFAGYVDKLFGLGEDSRTLSLRKYLAGSRLAGNEKIIYNILKEEIEKTASGTRTDTEFHIPVSRLTDKQQFTDREAGVTISGSISETDKYTIYENMLGISQESIPNILTALLADCPYELYWHDKTATTNGFVYPGISASTAGQTTTLSFTSDLVIRLTVDTGYKGSDNYHTNPTPITAAKTAAQNAQQIVADARSKTDFQKLDFYRQKICELTAYNRSAADNSYTGDSNPWQLIYVFDNNPSTNVVCEGYAKAFQYLCDMTDFQNEIYSYIVYGNMTGGTGAGPHMWNLVHAGDSGIYLVDVTNCDSGTVGADDDLFLTGYTSGDLENGYTIQLPRASITYKYDTELKNIYSTEDLTLTTGGKLEERKLHTHSWTITQSTAASCTESGKTDFKCSECNKTKTETTAALGHTYEAEFHWSGNYDSCTVSLTCKNDSAHKTDAAGTVSSSVKTPATCTAKGTTTYTASASIEGKTYTNSKDLQNIAVNPSNHAGGTEIRNAKSATSASDGYTGDSYCKSCGVKTADGKVIPKGSTPDNSLPPSQTPVSEEDLTKTETATNPDGSVTTTVTKTDESGNVIESTKTTVNPDGSSVKTVTADSTNSKGKTVTVSTTTNTDTSGAVTNVATQSVIADIAPDASAAVTVTADAAGAVTDVQAEITQKAGSTNQAVLTNDIIAQIAEAARQKNASITMTVQDADGNSRFKLKADTQDLTAGNKLYLYCIDQTTGEFVMTNGKAYTVDKAGNISVPMNGSKTYQLVNKAQASKINKEILNTVKAKKTSVSLKKGKTTTFSFNTKLNMDNVKQIKYTSSKKTVAKVSAKGKITAKRTGSAVVKAKVTLKNGTVKTVSMKIKVTPLYNSYWR